MNLHWGWMSLGTDTHSIVIICNFALLILPLALSAHLISHSPARR